VIPGPLAKYAADLASLPGDASLGYRHEGLRGVWDAVAARTVHRVIRASRLTVFAQTVEWIPDIAPPAGVRLERLRPESVEGLAPIVGARDRKRFLRLLEVGCTGLVAWRGPDPVGYAWVAQEMRLEVSQCPLELPPHAAYLWDLYVVPSERGSGLGSALAAERLRVAREQGRREGWRMITPGNIPSLRTLRRSGPAPRIIGEFRYLKLGPRLFARFTPCPPPTH
jgi:GNAT superfamily N-acetyltransferase